MSVFTVTTASMPSRRELLAEAAESLYAQTAPPAAWLIRVEDPGSRYGVAHLAEQRNILLEAVHTEWVATLDDDDLLDRNYLEVMGANLDDADVVYAFCRGREHVRSTWNPDLLRQTNYICGVACVRTEIARSVGGWPTDGQLEDWGMWKKLLDAGARFRCVEQELWTHRRGDWKTLT